MERIGFVGLGIMGKPMALNLRHAGFPLTVLETHKPAMQELVAAGAVTAPTLVHLAAQSDIVISMLPDSSVVLSVLEDAEGILAGLRPGSLFVDMSTIQPSAARRIAANVRGRGSEALDAPVSGGEVGAQNATLSIMVGGAEAAFERARPALAHMGRNVTRIGEAGAGQIAKAANQIIVGVTIGAVAEALLLAAKAGADPARVREALMGGFASSRVLELHGKRMVDRAFAPGGKVRFHRKDMNIVAETARELGLPLPLSATVTELFDGVVANGGADLDHSALIILLEKLAQFQIHPAG